MQPVEPSTDEHAQFRATVRRQGGDVDAFRFWKFAHPGGLKVRVFGRGHAAVYEVPETESWTTLFAHDLKKGVFSQRVTELSPECLRVLRAVASRWQKAMMEGGLELMNKRVPHRFTAIYNFDGDVVRNMALVDREKSIDSFALQAVPMGDSFCQFVLRDGGFVTNDSGHDERLAGHPYSGIVNSYVGVPIPLASGELYGTLCHFDFVPRELPQAEHALLERAGQILPKYLDGLKRA